MHKIALLTPTYNHPQNLLALYASLVQQTSSEFTWVIIDDGSLPDTAKTVEMMQNEGKLDLLYHRQENGGKSKAVNTGLDYCAGSVFLLIVDDDMELIPEAVQTLLDYVARYGETKVGVFHCNLRDETGKVIAQPHIEEDQIMTFSERRRKGIFGDGMIGYFTDKLGDTRFPLQPGERYMGPSVLIMTVCQRYQMLWAKSVLGKTEYLEGGITKLGRGLRLKNPYGMIIYCTLMCGEEETLKWKLKYSIMGYAYQYYAGISKRELNERGIDCNAFRPLMKLPGKMLAAYWKSKYKK